MKKIYLNITFSLLSFSFAGNNASAQTEPYHLGPCYGEIAKEENRIAYDMGENVDISAAVYIPASYAATVAGGPDHTRVASNSKIKSLQPHRLDPRRPPTARTSRKHSLNPSPFPKAGTK